MAFDAALLRERYAEQLMSDEHLLGVAPEDAVKPALDAALAQLDTSAARAGSEEELDAAFDSIRRQARTLLEQAATQDDPAAFVRASLAAGALDAPEAAFPASQPAGEGEAGAISADAVEAGAQARSSDERAPADDASADVKASAVLPGQPERASAAQTKADVAGYPTREVREQGDGPGVWGRFRRWGRRLRR